MEQEQENQNSQPQATEEPIEPAMYQSRRQALALPEQADPNDTFLSNIHKSPSFFD